LLKLPPGLEPVYFDGAFARAAKLAVKE